MSAVIERIKDPGERLNFGIDYADEMAADGETSLASSTWSVSTPTGLTVESLAPYAPYISTTFAMVWVSGGTDGVNYVLTNTAVGANAAAHRYVKSIVIRVQTQ